MRASILNVETLQSIEIHDVIRYLNARAWILVDGGERTAIWRRHIGDDVVEILLPLDRSLRDFVPRMAEVLQTLEIVENRSQLTIVTDISGIQNDVIRIGAEGARLMDGTLPLEAGLAFIQGAFNVIVAAAVATARPYQTFFSRRPQEVSQYLQNVRLGQSERGSYILTIQTPANELYSARSSYDLFDLTNTEQLVTSTLLNGMGLLADPDLRVTALKNDSSVFSSNNGVTANLCEAVVSMFEATNAEQLRIAVTWAATRQRSREARSVVAISESAVEEIRQLGKVLRQTDLDGDYVLEGLVIRLNDTPDNPHSATILGLVGLKERRVKALLNPRDYDLAISAHRNNQPVRVTGKLMREGRRFVLRDVERIELQDHT